MFSVKATYHGEIRRFSFPGATTFPTFDQLYTQLHRVFPSSNRYYLSKLLFCPDSSNPARILIAREVHTADDYNKCLVPFQGRSWPNALLRFSLLDQNFSGIGSGNFLSQPVGQVPWGRAVSSADKSSPSQATPRPMSSFYIPPPPVTFSVPPRAFSQAPMDIDPVLVDVSNQSSHTLYSEPRAVPSSMHRHPSGCCSVAQTKAEVQTLLQTFQQDLDRILGHTFGYTSNQNTEHFNTSTITPPPTAPVNDSFAPFHSLQSDCSSCRQPVVGQWFTCNDCSALVCSECNIYDRASFCGVSLGRHALRLAPSPNAPPSHGTFPSGPLSRSSWAPRPLPFVTPVAPLWVPSSTSTYNGFAYSSPYTTSSPPVQPFIPPLRTPSPETSFTPIPHTSNVSPQLSRMYSPSPVVPAASYTTGSARLTTTPLPAPVVHRGVVCDACDATIVGIRHKCLDCPDYDLCTPCMASDSSERHNPRHQFLELAEPTRIVIHTVNQDDERAPLDPASFAPAAPTSNLPVLHHATCDLCDSIIQGYRYKCTVCPDFDTCDSCFTITDEQHPDHSFVKLSKAEDYISRGHSIRRRHFARCDVCNKSIEGARYKCMHPNCPDFDLCEKCEALPMPQHPDNHPMLKMKSVETVIPTVYRVGQTSTHPVPERVQTPTYERGYMHNPSVSWGTVTSELPSPIARPLRSPSPSALGFRPSYEAVERALSSATPQSPPSHRDYRQFPPQRRSISPSSVLSNSEPHSASERSYFSSQWTAPVDYSLYPLNDTPSRSDFDSWPEFAIPRSPILVQPLTEAITASRNTTSSTNDILTSEFDPVGRPFVVSPSSSNTPGNPEVHGTATPDSLVNSESWLNSIVRPVSEQPATSDYEVQPTAPDSPPQPTTAESPLNNEALLSRPPISEMRQIFPPNNRSLTELLNGYHSMSSLRLEDYGTLQRSVTTDIVEEPLSAGFVGDITAPDGQIFAAGVTFIKVWRMVNNGTRDWPASTEVAFAGGAQLATGSPPPHIQPMSTVGPLKPGEEKNVWTCELKAPDAPGKYTSYWRLRDDKGQLFGESIWVEIEVVNPSYSQLDESLTSSSIIVMPNPTSPQASPSVPSSERILSRSPTINTEPTSDDGDFDSDSVSLISMPSSEDEEDVALWADSRARATADYVAEHASQAMEYVLLYDDNTSEEE